MCARGRWSVRAAITLPRQDKDWLIFLDSSSLLPVAPVTLTLSLPAKSTKLSLPTLIYLGASSSTYWPLLSTYCYCCSMVVICSTMMMKTACERELMSFILVVAVARLSAPFCMRL